MSCSGTCELVEFRVKSSRFIHIAPRPRADAPQDLEQRLLDLVKEALETTSHGCGAECDCVIGEPVLVSSREQVKKVTYDGYDAWYQVTLAKYRTPGECMPATDAVPEGVRGG